jgi:hypothetical protein
MAGKRISRPIGIQRNLMDLKRVVLFVVLLLQIATVLGQQTIWSQGKDGFSNIVPMKNTTIQISGDGRQM